VREAVEEGKEEGGGPRNRVRKNLEKKRVGLGEEGSDFYGGKNHGPQRRWVRGLKIKKYANGGSTYACGTERRKRAKNQVVLENRKDLAKKLEGNTGRTG